MNYTECLLEVTVLRKQLEALETCDHAADALEQLRVVQHQLRSLVRKLTKLAAAYAATYAAREAEEARAAVRRSGLPHAAQEDK